ncbi:MAG: hypothetical protein J6X44_03090 [Thermoguttaceae bacterium]|nr:hypothetical protein [Thermoguttaceae bacterium]
MKKLFALMLALVAVCAMSVASLAANYGDVTTEWNEDGAFWVTTVWNEDGSPFVTVEGLNKVPNCNSTTKYLDSYNLAVFKKGKYFVIWTDKALTGDQRAALKYAIEQSSQYEKDDLANMKNLEFASGYDVPFGLQFLGQYVKINDEGVIKFDKKCTWSWFYRGFCTFPEPEAVEYEWVATGEGDSATGYDPNGTINAKGNWFMYNTVNVGAMAVGDTATFYIQAGQWKNGTNFVGAYAITKVDVDQYEIAFDDFNLITDSYAARFDGYHLWFNGTGKFVTSPGNQKGKATAAAKETPFVFTGSTLYVFAHFNVSYWAKVPVQAAEPIYLK